MNCKPGDLARVISTVETRECGIEDWFFKVTKLNGLAQSGQPAWDYEGPLRKVPKGFYRGNTVLGVADRILRPIRDPGDDAVDETLRHLRVVVKA